MHAICVTKTSSACIYYACVCMYIYDVIHVYVYIRMLYVCIYIYIYMYMCLGMYALSCRYITAVVTLFDYVHACICTHK